MTGSMGLVVLAASEDSTSHSKKMSEPSAISSGTGTARKSSRKEPRKVGWMWLPSGTTSPLSMADSGKEDVTSSMVDSHVRIYPKQGKVKVSSKEKQEAAFFMKWYALQLKYDLAFCSWKTSQQSLGGVLISYSGNFIKRGMMRNGSLYRPRRLELPIGGNGGSVWLGTPTATMKMRSEKFRRGDGYERMPNPAEYAEEMYLTPSTIQITPKNGRFEKRKAYRESIGRHWVPGCLEEQIQTWPTPNCSDVFTDNLKSSQQKEGSLHSVNLSQKVMWPTPRHKESTESKESIEARRKRTGCGMMNLTAAVYPTPRAREGNSGPIGSKSQIHQMKRGYLDATIYEQELGEPTQQNQSLRLNPLWVEWLMGFPKGWTDLNASVTPWFPSKEEQPGKC